MSAHKYWSSGEAAETGISGEFYRTAPLRSDKSQPASRYVQIDAFLFFFGATVSLRVVNGLFAEVGPFKPVSVFSPEVAAVWNTVH